VKNLLNFQVQSEKLTVLKFTRGGSY